MKSNRCWLAVLLVWASIATVAPAQTLTTLFSFDNFNGEDPVALVQGVDGNFYGTTAGGGVNCAPYGCGTVFKMSPSGNLTVLYNFCSQPSCADGMYPYAGMIQATDGNFYGTTSQGGSNLHAGTIFRITPAGNFTMIYSFCSQTNCTDGNYPTGGLIQGADKYLYGTTFDGGQGDAQYCDGACGTVFKISLDGTFTSIHRFTGYNLEGSSPNAALVQAKNGNFYGTTQYGGAYDNCTFGYGCGTVFEITPNGKLTTLHSFAGRPADGAMPYAGLASTAGRMLFGTTSTGGANDQGTVFKVTPMGDLQTIYNFCSEPNCTDGFMPEAGLVLAAGSLYGTAQGGAYASGLVFNLTPEDALVPLYSFCSEGYPQCPDGDFPEGMFQATNGAFYGTTSEGGDLSCDSPYGCGTVFRLDLGLHPFVKTLPAAAKIGTEIGILGNSLVGATGVTFNGTSAQFTVKSSTLILARVPTAATSGTVQVTLPNSTLSSNVPFYVLP
jgi:uncharacterized repeat protein (TIGR03803 family)